MVLLRVLLLVTYSRRKGNTKDETQREQSRSIINKPWTPSQILVRSKIQDSVLSYAKDLFLFAVCCS
jgi:hypothetical protein